MCGRFSLFNFSIDKIKLTSINNENIINYNSNYNIYPIDYTPALYSFKNQLYISYMKWGITLKFTNKQTIKKILLMQDLIVYILNQHLKVLLIIKDVLLLQQVIMNGKK